jgi:exodeoxyribonuclease VII small subunit
LTCTFQLGYFSALFLNALPPMPESSAKAGLSPKAGQVDKASLLGEAAKSESDGSGVSTPAFEQAMQELEQLVTRMESGELSLEQSLAAYKRGARLLQICQGALQDAQQQVKVLEEGLLQDFAGGAEQD